ncbi:[protein release factor]-glutamine N5-methyltransferase [Sulfurivirga caldicuralii]|uniref:Release factor glutamine methyltransferase n=1 Tax=Sulfurivirga caldicuralii TaxID=364032 RepID=A0A1N6GK08_9GAMM|nr:peptide chain release factor N(5)-glutamine methyltransferase [Sulfurivirga caldicuralii]SIO07732.1 [protein release factor]-glutamine N5-methyltransferase [Sulfurivirga caldicuralii]
MTVADALRHAQAQLQHSDTPDLDAQLLLAHVLGKSRSWLFAHDIDALTADQQAAFAALTARRAAGEPVAYLLGRADFYDFTLKVTPDVLIPRPETELLVEQALEKVREKSAAKKVGDPPVCAVDLGTGSGAIAIALARHAPEVAVAASDASCAALTVARENAQRLGVDIDFRHGSWLEPFAGERFDVIASNPPYIDSADPHLRGDIRHEPQQALVAGEHGLADLRAIIERAPAHLNAGGWLLLEHGYDQQDAVESLFRAAGFDAIVCLHDLAGQPRVSLAQWNN